MPKGPGYTLLASQCVKKNTPGSRDFYFYNQQNQESHGGLPHRQTPFVPHVLRYEPSKALEKPGNVVTK
jgi:hypothetical protein